MYLVKKLYVELQTEDKVELLDKARDISQGISEDEFIEYIESMLNGVVCMIDNELNHRDSK